MMEDLVNLVWSLVAIACWAVMIIMVMVGL